MTLLEWKEQYSLGVPAVDHEHRELIDLINELYASVKGPAADVTVIDFLGELYARISAHFALEEKIMRDSHYDQYRDHKTDHERLLDDIRDLMDDYEDGVHVDVEAFGKHLEEWFSEHFRTRDARLHKKIF
ncbi:MAG: bacteriohemerythrin [Lysobacterales bacterium]|nr:MAG: bacteriohemerythrin [Xanthomonadales bacterium]